MNETAKLATGKENGSQMRITEEELNLIISAFKNNERLLKLTRKMFLPELDANAPIGAMIDLYKTILTKDRDPMNVTVDLMARNMLIDHVDSVLMQLNLLAKMEKQTPEEVKAKLKDNSNK